MFIISFLTRAILILAIVTAIGQVRWEERSLESRYHSFVNSDGFQDWFWAMSLPVTWSSEKIEKGLKALLHKNSNKAEEAAR